MVIKFILNLVLFLIIQPCIVALGLYAHQFENDMSVILITLLAWLVAFLQFIWRVISCICGKS